MPEDAPLPYSGTPTPSLPHVVLGDQGYPLKKYMLKPYERKYATEDELHFNNYKLSSVRRVVECAFGILVVKWRVLKTEIQCEPKNIDTIVKCASLLHNIVIDMEGSREIDNWFANNEHTPENPLTQYQSSLDARRYNRSTSQAVKNRDAFKHYFKCSK